MIAGPFAIPMNIISDAIIEKIYLYFYGWCEYDDVFQGTSRHRTEFCLKLVPIQRLSDAVEGAKRSAVTLRYHPEHNGADNDCLKPIKTGSRKNPLPKAII